MDSSQSQQSIFVTVLSWVLIIITGGMAFIAGLQNIMLHTVFPEEMFQQTEKSAEAMANAPWYAELLFNHFQMIAFLGFLILCLACIASIALLKRRNWGRYFIIGMLGLGIAWNIASLGFQLSMKGEMEAFQQQAFEQMNQYEKKDGATQDEKTDDEPCCESDPCCNKEPLSAEEQQQRIEEQRARWEEMNQQSNRMMSIMMMFALLTTVVFSAVEGWIIWKLTRPEIVAEFKNNNGLATDSNSYT